jgi:hypothetical protein
VGDLTPGVYEHLLTEALHGRLAGTDADLISLGELDPVDAHETLTRHIAELASRALRIAGGSDRAAVSRQVALAKDMRKAITALAPDAAAEGDAVVEPPRTLLAVAQPFPTPGAAGGGHGDRTWPGRCNLRRPGPT